ncbi:PREDICTED: pentatricopeptide repeat-containing protein At3g22670, mitochondrial [Tarenaya hassleriana]|uniref:pentatricopeptide repeat-containing protein At3g22670, mitochondrial n=1 Tax=Tarenaya hassleriana TaxID=28532 RepID=UPI00053C8FAE|nr:PREDICTED: pentatricopeptide repeat-containing protein At3g22670, mitochondrial [Tarenaya hassleriana]
MQSKLRVSKLVSFFSPKRFCERRFLMPSNALSVAAESPVPVDSSDSAESPELPSWVTDFLANRSSATAVSEDEDFVIPSLASWVESQRLEDGRSPWQVAGEKPVSDTDKVGEFLKKMYPFTDDYVEELKGCDVVVSDDLVSQVLRRFSNEWVRAYGFFTWAKSQTGYRHSPETYNAMVDVLGKCRKFDLMWELVEEMNSEAGFITLDTMIKVMRRLAKARQYSEAIQAFQGMERYGVMKNTKALNLLMDTLVKENSVEHANEAFLELNDSFPPNVATFNILIHGYCKARKFDDARRMMDEMRKHGFLPDEVSYTSFVEGYCREKDFRRVYEILEEMQENGCRSNSVTYTIVMHALGKAKQVGEALGIYERMKQEGCVLDAMFYSSLIHILSKTGRFKDATEIFEDMTKQGVPREVLTYNTMITAACDHSQEEMAIGLLKRMGEESCGPDIDTYAPLLKMCCQKKRVKLLRLLLHHMVKNNVSIGVATYILLIRGLCRSGKLAEACSFFEEAVLKGMVPRDSTCRMLLEELERKGMTEDKSKIQTLMSQLKVTVD